MRVIRVLKRTLLVLMFVCMTLKIQLELRVLRAGRDNGGYSPWWGNETLGHLRAFPKLATRTNVTLADRSLIPSKTGAASLSGVTLKASGNVNHMPPQQEKHSDPNSSYRKILSDATNKNNPAEASSSGRLSENSRGIERNVTAPKSPRNHNIRGDMFAKLKIYDGENTIDTDTIYYSQKRANASKNTNDKGNTSINQSNGKIATSTNKKQVPEKQTIKAQILRRAMAPTPGNIKTPSPPRISKRPFVPIPKSNGPASGSVRAKAKHISTKEVSHDVDKNEMSLTTEEIVDTKMELREENEKQTVYNQERFGPVLQNTTIFLIQVHKRLENLRYLVESLRAVKGIQEAMVVFSHDLWDPAINAFVRNITEFRVMQMFFPFSIQLYPLVFPGRDPADCSWNTNTDGKKNTCKNANWPDSYGHYREASFTQIKHHWWWKINRVFEGLRVTQNNYTGHVVFLEEDHYASPDLLHVLYLMQRLRPALCPTCKVLALGNYNKLNPHVYKNFVEHGDWWVTKYNMGFAMDAAVWRSLNRCKDHFCNFDDYNWDWTMTNVVQTCLPTRLPMPSVRLTRVLHVGSCGTHVRKKVCDVRGEVRNAVRRLTASRQWLYPTTLVLQGSWKKSGKPKKGNGGWGDYRDRQLCGTIGNHTTNEVTLARLQNMTSI